jgi:DNA (cytosine-5)-methyltransferase 1
VKSGTRTCVPSDRARRFRRMPPRRTHSRPDLRSLELFVGAGGLALGLRRSGFRADLLVDWDEHAYQTLRTNRTAPGRSTMGWPIEKEDVRRLTYDEYDDVDLLAAGAPCQPFSQGGRLRGEDDDRNMFPEVIRAIREVEPRAFLLENVRGLLFRSVRPYFDYLLAQLRQPSRKRKKDEDWEDHLARLNAVPEWRHEYRVYWRVVNAADFGVAQNRPRLVVIGLRIDETKDWEWPEATHSRVALLRALAGDDYWREHGVPKRIREAVRETLPKKLPPEDGRERWRTLRDLTAELGSPTKRVNGDAAHVFVPGARLYDRHTGSRLDWPAKTVKAGVHGAPGGEHIVLKDDGSYRYLTVRECAALQGFPRRYALPELRSHAMRQLGNAVPVPLAEAFGKKLVEVLDG